MPDKPLSVACELEDILIIDGQSVESLIVFLTGNIEEAERAWICSIPQQTKVVCAQTVFSNWYGDFERAIAFLEAHEFDAALILTQAGQSPYTLAYICYLAGIPIRIGASEEFGGGVLSHAVADVFSSG